MAKKTDLAVLIVGGGPTGLTLALECCRHNIPFRIIDAKAARDPYSKALVIWHGTMQMLQAQGILTDFLQAGLLAQKITFADQGRPIVTLNPAESDFGSLQGPLFLSQCETERLLEAKLNAYGKQLERGVQLTAFTENAQGIEATLKHAEGQEEVVQVEWLAGCDGARSLVRKTLEQQGRVEFTGYTEAATYILADVEYSGDYQNDQVFISWGKNASVALFPVTAKILRIIAERTTHSDLPPTLTEIQEFMDQNGPKIQLKNPVWLSAFRINERLSSHTQQGRIFLLGDAAHIHSPAGGQGMNTGMQDAFNLGWKLAYLAKSPQNALLLNSYESERRPIAKKVILESSRRLHFGMLQNPLMRILKDTLLPLLTKIKPIQHKILADLTGLFIEYPHSPLIIPNSKLHAAKRPGKKWLEPLATKAFGSEHVLLVFAKTPPEFEAFKQTVQPYLKATKVEIVPTINPDESELWYLIRPDQFIAAGDKLSCLQDLDWYFKNLLGV